MVIVAIIAGIIGIFLVIGLIGMILGAAVAIVKMLFEVVVFLLKWVLILSIPVGIIGGFVYLFTIIGYWAIIGFAGFCLLVWLIMRLGPESLETRVTRYFQTHEMASLQDLNNKLEGNPDFREINSLLTKMAQKGKVEIVDLGTGKKLYRWTEKRDYAQGVITSHLNVD